ncbi:histidinol-phosphate transaminase [Haliangium sp.]|uniref:histidinol-phosphate transaminase n=1 Tax=Haliangium sp. TaxID=2663208 RepID=UPI003D0AF19B
MSIPFRPNIAAMAGYVPGEQPPAGTRLIKLNTNENPYPPSPTVAEAIRAELEAGGAPGARLRLYSDPNGDALRDAAAEVTGHPREGILVGNGSDELLSVLARAFVGEDDTVAFPYPTYVLYETMAHIQGAAVQTVDFPRDFSLPSALGEVEARLVFVANPNSPSGTSATAEELAALADRRPDTVFVIDEAYAAFAGANALALARSRPNVVVLRTLSKSHSLAGMRVGLLFGSAEMVAGLAKVRDSYSLDRLAIVAGAAAVRDTAWVERNVACITATRGRLVAELERLGWSPLPSRANFVFVRMGSPNRARDAYLFLRGRGILVRYFALRLLDDGLRITVGTDPDIDALISALADFAVA